MKTMQTSWASISWPFCDVILELQVIIIYVQKRWKRSWKCYRAGGGWFMINYYGKDSPLRLWSFAPQHTLARFEMSASRGKTSLNARDWWKGKKLFIKKFNQNVKQWAVIQKSGVQTVMSAGFHGLKCGEHICNMTVMCPTRNGSSVTKKGSNEEEWISGTTRSQWHKIWHEIFLWPFRGGAPWSRTGGWESEGGIPGDGEECCLEEWQRDDAVDQIRK